VRTIHSQSLFEFNLYSWIHFRALKNTQKGNLFAAAANAGGRYGSFLASAAHAMRPAYSPKPFQ
jgi:hypothetical protein